MNHFKKFTTTWKLSSLAAIAGVLLSGCGGGAPEDSTPNNGVPAKAEKLSKVTVGYTPTIVLPQPLIGLEEDRYAKEVSGVTFEGKEYDAGSGVIEALRAGSIDIGSSGPYPALKAYAKDKDIVLLGGAGTGGTALMVLQSSPYKSVKDLKGKVVGVNQLGSTVDAFVRYNLLQAGLKPDRDVQIIKAAPGEQAALLQGGQVAAVAAPAPWPSQVQITAKARPLLDWKQILDNGTYSSGSIYTTKKFADAHPEFIKRFLAAHKKITDELNKDRVKGDARVLAAWSKVSKKTLKPDVAKAAFATIKFTIDPDAKGLQKQADIALETGGLKKKADLSGFVYEVK
jgi:NitT/TauT family transport system substrate-binding protein